MTEKIKITLIIGFSIIIAASVGAFLNYQNKKAEREFILEQSKLEKEDLQNNQQLQELCISDVNARVSKSMETWCSDRKLPENCTIPNETAEQILRFTNEQKELCIKRYEN